MPILSVEIPSSGHLTPRSGRNKSAGGQRTRTASNCEVRGLRLAVASSPAQWHYLILRSPALCQRQEQTPSSDSQRRVGTDTTTRPQSEPFHQAGFGTADKQVTLEPVMDRLRFPFFPCWCEAAMTSLRVSSPQGGLQRHQTTRPSRHCARLVAGCTSAARH